MISALDIIEFVVEELGFQKRDVPSDFTEYYRGEMPHPADYASEETEGKIYRKHKYAVSIVTEKLVPVIVVVDPAGESCEIHECSSLNWGETIEVDLREDDLEKLLVMSIEANS